MHSPQSMQASKTTFTLSFSTALFDGKTGQFLIHLLHPVHNSFVFIKLTPIHLLCLNLIYVFYPIFFLISTKYDNFYSK